MRKLLLSFLFITMGFSLIGCFGNPIDVTVDEAFELMNESIQNYLDADSVELIYSGVYTSSINNLTDELHVRMKRAGSESLVGNVIISVAANNDVYGFYNNYQDGVLYSNRIENNESTKVKEVYLAATFVTLYKSFLKSTIALEDTRDLAILTTSDTISLTFELASTAIESTLYVLQAMDSAKLATVTMTFTPRGRLISMDVAYEAEIDDVFGSFTYDVSFDKIDRYIIVPQLSTSEISAYQEKVDEAE